MTLFSDGDYIWEGLNHVSRRGVHRGRLASAVFPRALAELESARYRELKDSYVYGAGDGCREDWTDNPTIRIFIQKNGSSKEILHNHGCRGFSREKELIALEDRLDEILGLKRWIGAR
jgi:hypothetical protein